MLDKLSEIKKSLPIDKYEFGDILDGIDAPELEHFILIVGEKGRKQIMYYKIFSRVYKLFDGLIEHFNDCVNKECNIFKHNFGKEKDNDYIIKVGNLRDALFLDINDYDSHLTRDSFILVNDDPKLIDKNILRNMAKVGMVSHATKLTSFDINKFMVLVNYSKNLSAPYIHPIREAFNKTKKNNT